MGGADGGKIVAFGWKKKITHAQSPVLSCYGTDLWVSLRNVVVCIGFTDGGRDHIIIIVAVVGHGLGGGRRCWYRLGFMGP